jgi:hypothetical protein
MAMDSVIVASMVVGIVRVIKTGVVLLVIKMKRISLMRLHAVVVGPTTMLPFATAMVSVTSHSRATKYVFVQRVTLVTIVPNAMMGTKLHQPLLQSVKVSVH